MNQIRQIFLKDIRHHWPEIATSIALLAAYGRNEVVAWSQPPELVAYANPSAFLNYRLLAGAVNVALPLAWAFLILRVVQTESLVGDRQFWVTRPYEWTSLLAEKILFILAFLNVPIFILQLTLLRLAGFHPTHYLVGLLWMQMVLCLFAFLPIITLAVLTATVVQALLGVLLVVLYFTGMSFLEQYIPSSSFSGFGGNLTGLLFFGISVAVILLQYARRKTVIARLLIVVLGAALLLILIVTPYRTIMARDFPALPAGQKAPFKLGLLPAQAAYSAAPVTEKEVAIRIPLSVSGLAPESIIAVAGIMLELNAPGAPSWNSGWMTNGTEIYPERSQTEFGFTLKKRVFQRMHSSPVTLHLSLAYTLFRQTNQREFVIPNGVFTLQAVGVCAAEPRGYLQELQCVAPLRRPESFLITTDPSASTCSLRVAAGLPRFRTAGCKFRQLPGHFAGSGREHPESQTARILFAAPDDRSSIGTISRLLGV